MPHRKVCTCPSKRRAPKLMPSPVLPRAKPLLPIKRERGSRKLRPLLSVEVAPPLHLTMARGLKQNASKMSSERVGQKAHWEVLAYSQGRTFQSINN